MLVVIALQLMLKILELTVNSEIVVSVVVAEPLKAAEASAVPHTKTSAEKAV